MGLFDEVVLDPPVCCSTCGKAFSILQTHAFDDTLTRYRVGDCPGHAEELRVVRETVWCDQCRAPNDQRTVVYLVIVRGILVAVEQDLDAAQRRLRAPSLEDLALWYHDLYRRKTDCARSMHSHRRFLEEVLAFLRNPEQILDRRFPSFLSHYFASGENIATAVEKYLLEHPASGEEEPGGLF